MLPPSSTARGRWAPHHAAGDLRAPHAGRAAPATGPATATATASATAPTPAPATTPPCPAPPTAGGRIAQALTAAALAAATWLAAPAAAVATGPGPAIVPVAQTTGAQPRPSPGKNAAARPAPRQQAKPGARKPGPATSRRAAAAAAAPLLGLTPDVKAFAADTAARHGLPLDWMLQHLGQARRVESVRQLIMPPPAGTAKDWAAYRARFVEDRRIQAGVAFWRAHERWLTLAEERWGVPPELVVGIVGVETFYGRFMGTHRVLDALATLAFDFPPGRRDRSAFFRSELEEFFVLAHREGLDPTQPKGSYAGAMGLPQFMPSSLNRWAVDMDGDGHVDLHTNGADVVGSVAHYLAAFGWQRGMPTHYAVRPPVDSRDRAWLLGPDILPTFTAQQMADRGAALDEPGTRHTGPLALVELQNGDLAPSYVAGTENFYVITRYNWSSYYALAVIDLAQAVKAAR